jgi:REP element-mobilizing transposase RayT
MPRQPGLDTPGVPQHVIQPGNDRQRCFFDDPDYSRCRSDLREITLCEGCAVPAYVRMSNHVHLLVTSTAMGAVDRMMQSLGRRYLHYINDRYHRDALDAIRRHVQCPHAYGPNRFRAAIEAQLGCPVQPQKIGRPKKSDQAQRSREKPRCPLFAL